MKPIVLLVLDGYGYREYTRGNAIAVAITPNFNYLWHKYPHSTLEACGKKVGLPSGTAGLGSSEIGHLNIGAGRIVYQPRALIDKKLEEGEFFTNSELLSTIEHVRKNNSKLHIFGLLSDGNVHSHYKHLFALLDLVKSQGIEKVYIHACTDGRDTPIDSSMKYIKKLQIRMQKIGVGKIATISGRYYPMDRDRKWDRIKLGYDAMVFGKGEYYPDIEEAIKKSYAEGITDEFVVPFVVDKDGMIEENDGFINFNYRKDREVELMTALSKKDFKEFETKKFKNVKFTTFMFVSEQLDCAYAFKLDELENTLGEYLAEKGIWQLRLAETEKYVYVTSVFDGMEEKKLDYCDQVLVHSPSVATFDLKPEMSIYEVTDTFISKINEDKYEVIIMNFANPDMVGHTGVFDAAVDAIEHVDKCLGAVYNKTMEKDGILIVTANHGNADVMFDEKDRPVTSHSYSLVPFILCNTSYTKVKNGKLGDIAPTMLKLMGVDIPKEMTGDILIEM